MRKILLLLLPALIVTSSIEAQNVIWASKVVSYSSQYAAKQYGAIQALGKPNVLPQGKDSPCAWSPLKEMNRDQEYIQVEFPTTIHAKQVMIGESHNPGAISKVILYDVHGKEHEVYSNSMTRAVVERSRLFQVKFAKTSYRVKGAKIILNTLDVPGWNHVDCIGISATDEKFEPKINLASEIEFKSKPINLGTGINSRYDEIMPIISPDGKTLYFDRKDHPENTTGKLNDDIWYSEVDASGFWKPAINIGTPLNNNGHNFLSAITPDGNTALLGNVYAADGSMASGLSISERTTTGWSFPKKLNVLNYFNRNQYSEFHMGADGKTIIMAIERDDSYGGKDLYVSFRMSNGVWTEPKNLGEVVNSADTEMSPFLAADGKTLYFSSMGHPGYGSNDMFMVRRQDDSWTSWTEPQNLGKAINSKSWDAYYSIPASGDYAYFSSENHSIGKTDIFKIKLPEEIKPEPVVLLSGKVLNKDNGQPIAAEISYENLHTGEEIGVAHSNPKTGEYKIVLPAGMNYGFRAKAENFISINEHLDLTDIKEYKEMSRDLLLAPLKKGEVVVMNNIFFAPSSATLTPDSKPELDRVVQMLKDHPTMQIEVGGHTNNSCSEEWCMKLSTDRAKSVTIYIIKHGVDSKRLKWKGYGSKKPLCPNTNIDCKRKNRRVEFTVLEV